MYEVEGTDGSGVPWVFLLQVVLGLPSALWFYKCLMLVLFQRRIIYLPSVPPGTRDESLADGERTRERDSSLSGMNWQEVRVESTAPTRWLRRKVELRGVELSWKEDETARQRSDIAGTTAGRRHVVVVYLQGNAGTPLLRIPLFRQLLRPDAPSRASSSPSPPLSPKVTLLAFAPRTFWLSTRSTPTEIAVLADYAAALAYAREKHGPGATYILKGHSLGGAATVLLLEQLGIPPFPPRDPSSSSAPAVDAVILENPLPSIPYMVRALYPQRWLPYHYLGPLAFDRWDATGRLDSLAAARQHSLNRTDGVGRRDSLAADKQQRPSSSSPSTTSHSLSPPPVPSLWIRSGRDEIIPHGADGGVRKMYEDWVAAAGGTEQARAKWVDVPGALHDTAFTERRWREEVRGFLEEVGRTKAKKVAGRGDSP
ncbi:hypothetical protein JCM10213v2_001022 [Rhodosporidiobolus nylandii]